MNEFRDPRIKSEHEHEIEPRSSRAWRRGPFDHERLDAYRVIRQAVVLGDAIARKLPRGFGELKDQLRRALSAAHLRFTEAVYRTGKDRLMRYRCSRAEAGEAAGALDQVTIMELAPANETEVVIDLLARFCAMTTKLAQLGPR